MPSAAAQLHQLQAAAVAGGESSAGGATPPSVVWPAAHQHIRRKKMVLPADSHLLLAHLPAPVSMLHYNP